MRRNDDNSVIQLYPYSNLQWKNGCLPYHLFLLFAWYFPVAADPVTCNSLHRISVARGHRLPPDAVWSPSPALSASIHALGPRYVSVRIWSPVAGFSACFSFFVFALQVFDFLVDFSGRSLSPPGQRDSHAGVLEPRALARRLICWALQSSVLVSAARSSVSDFRLAAACGLLRG
jgi:hypothetical protein